MANNCWRCGHSDKEHSVAHHDPLVEWCSVCYRSAVNKAKNRFFKHKFEGNLEYLERKAVEKNVY